MSNPPQSVWTDHVWAHLQFSERCIMVLWWRAGGNCSRGEETVLDFRSVSALI